MVLEEVLLREEVDAADPRTLFLPATSCSVFCFFFLVSSRLSLALVLVRGDNGPPVTVTVEGEQVLETTANADQLRFTIFLLSVLLDMKTQEFGE